jgi:hypothetical protein
MWEKFVSGHTVPLLLVPQSPGMVAGIRNNEKTYAGKFKGLERNSLRNRTVFMEGTGKFEF